MIPGVNGNAVTGSIPQTRSQAGVDAAPGGVDRTPGAIPAGTPINTAAIPKPYGVCLECKKHEMTINRLNSEMASLKTTEESARLDMADYAKRLEAASGVTINMRQAETIAKLQRADLTQRNDVWSLEQTNSHQSAEIRELQAQLRKAKGYPELVQSTDDRPFAPLPTETQLELELF